MSLKEVSLQHIICFFFQYPLLKGRFIQCYSYTIYFRVKYYNYTQKNDLEI